jgi:hypothetical protein
MSASAQDPPPDPANTPRGTGRLLFLDDDPDRASAFLTEYPEAVWVETVEQCLARLEEPWDEVHLDHDLGGETFVDLSRDDCGMAVVRWLCLHPRPHLKRTRFIVHSHNPNAAYVMVMQMMATGFQVEARPFGAPPSPPIPAPEAARSRGTAVQRVLRWLLGPGRRSFGPAPKPGSEPHVE